MRFLTRNIVAIVLIAIGYYFFSSRESQRPKDEEKLSYSTLKQFRKKKFIKNELDQIIFHLTANYR